MGSGQTGRDWDRGVVCANISRGAAQGVGLSPEGKDACVAEIHSQIQLYATNESVSPRYQCIASFPRFA